MLSPETLRQRLAVSALIGNCQALLKSGELNASQEASLRLLLQRTEHAFHISAAPKAITPSNKRHPQ
jgi:hypothetical protein